MLPPEVTAHLTRHHAVITHAALLQLGVDRAEVKRWAAQGSLVRLRRGAYTDAATWGEADEYHGRPRLLALAASATMQHRHVLSHDSAAHVLGLDFLQPARPLLHVTRDRVVGSRTCSGVKHHGAPYRAEQVVEVDGVRVLDPVRTALDLGREHGLHAGTSACDQALRRGATREDLVRAAADMWSWPQVTTVRRCIELADGGAENPGETLARIVVAGLGFGRPRTQFPVRTRWGLRWCDLVVGAHVIEFDGRLKYRESAAGERAGDVVWRERSRERALLDAGLGVSRVTWTELRADSVPATSARLIREINETVRRVGPVMPVHLERAATDLESQRTARLRHAA